MLKKWLAKLLGMDKYRGSHYRPNRSSDDYGKYGRRDPHSRHDPYPRHNQYGHQHYKKRGSSSSYSS